MAFFQQGMGGELSLAWDPVDDSRVGGYELGYRLSSDVDYNANPPIDVGNTTAFAVPGLNAGSTYVFRVRAYSQDRTLWSGFSNEASGTVPPAAGPDADGDSVPDVSDNCPSDANADQANYDGDSQGDVCDSDDDNDGVDDWNDSAAFDATNSGAVLALLDNGMDPGEHGHFFGDGAYYSVMAVTFEGDGSERLLRLQGFDIDYFGEVAVYLNDSFLGYLSPGPDNALNTPSLWWLPVALQVDGENRIELIETRPGYRWGVTGLGIYALGSAFGNLTTLMDGDMAHAEGFELHLLGSPDGYLLEFTGYDADDGHEIGLDLNGSPLVDLPAGTDDDWSQSDHLVLPADWLNAGDNVLFIQNLISDADQWGLRLDRLLPLGAELGNRLPGQAAVDERPDAVRYLIPPLADNSELSLEYYDVDTAVELEILQDDASLGYYAATTAQNAWGDTDVIVIPAGQRAVVEVDNTYNPPNNYIWGVRIQEFLVP